MRSEIPEKHVAWRGDGERQQQHCTRLNMSGEAERLGLAEV